MDGETHVQKSVIWSVSTIIATEIFFVIALNILFGFILNLSLYGTYTVIMISFFVGMLSGIRYIKKKSVITVQQANKIALWVLIVHIAMQLLVSVSFTPAVPLSTVITFYVVFDIITFVLIKRLSINSR